MDKRIQIWNILHDGEITAVSDELSNSLKISINIPYLRRRVKPLGDSFILTIEGLKDFAFYNFDKKSESLKEVIETGSPEILSTDSESMPVRITTTLGELILDFEDIHISLDTGEKIEFDIIEKIFQEYWTEWKTKSKKKPRD